MPSEEEKNKLKEQIASVAPELTHGTPRGGIELHEHSKELEQIGGERIERMFAEILQRLAALEAKFDRVQEAIQDWPPSR